MVRSSLLKSVAFSAIVLAATPAMAQEITDVIEPLPGGTFLTIYAFSDDGTAIAGYGDFPGGARGFHWQNDVLSYIGTLGGTYSYGITLSGDGSTVGGRSHVAGGVDHAIIWKNGILTDLGTLGGIYSQVYGLSYDGSVATGTSRNAGGENRAFRWEGGVMTDLGTLGGSYSTGEDITPDGSVIVGNSDTGVQQHAFRWEGGVMTDLGTLGLSSNAIKVSDDGSVVAGNGINMGSQWRAFRWEGGVMTNLGTLGGDYSYAYNMSADGSTVLGEAEAVDGNWYAFRWNGGVMTDLGTLGGLYSYASSSSANGSVIVGSAENVDSDMLLFRWTEEDGMQSLQDILTDAGVDMTGWLLNGDNGFISTDGSIIAGTGELNGDYRAFLMTMNGLTTPQEFSAALTPAVGVPTQAMDAMMVSTGQSMTASREAFASFSSGAFRMSAASLGSSAPSDLNNVSTAAGPSSASAPLYDDHRMAGYVIGSTAFAHEHASGDHNLSGTTGMFYRLSDEVAIGAGITGGHNKRELRLEGESRVASYGGNINIAYEGVEGFRVYGTAGASSLDIGMDRNYMNGAGVDTSKGETDGFSYGAALQAGYAVPVTDAIEIMPYAAIEASKTSIDGYTETGGAFPASFNDRDTSLVTSRLGAEVAFDTGHDMEIRARVAWGHVLSENGDDLSATVINLPQTIAYQEGRQDWIEGGVTFSWQYADSTRLVADIAGRSGKDTDTAATATLGVTFGF